MTIKDTDIIVVFPRDGGPEIKMTRAEYNKKAANGEFAAIPKTAVAEPVNYETVTFENIGNLLGKAVVQIKRANGAIPTPAQLGVDNTVVGLDGITNYAFVIREALRLLGYISVADGAMV
jgi:hypothetical protein